ncbi:T9SS type A sorting domain-containing protein [Flavobacteriales bacterium]|nr:T9SS type A sorting domain-containing protein [Flavobacteriales bacterium]
MKFNTLFLSIALFLIWSNNFSQDFTSNLEPLAPMKTSNNAVSGGLLNGIPHVYSFGGIDTTKSFSGIHLKSFRYNTQTQIWDTIPDLPDTRGKVAAGASTIDSIIYIIGGYYVFQNGSEISSDDIHRFNINTNSYLSDGATIPVSTDDHVQAVWNDSLIYVITGWSNSGNIPNVQIYNPKTDTWSTGNPVPNNNRFKSFGASGTIVGNTIYYYGGSSSGFGFPIQNILRVGVINPQNPTQITWRDSTINPSTACYRSACIGNSRGINWLGGSEVTYNYNGIAYNGSGGVSATNRNIYYNTSDSTLSYKFIYGDSLPMDLRGIADFGNTKYIVGGMIGNQEVTNKVWKLEYVTVSLEEKTLLDVSIYPNPVANFVTLETSNSAIKNVSLYSKEGKLIAEYSINNTKTEIDLTNLSSGIYLLRIQTGTNSVTKKIIKQ